MKTEYLLRVLAILLCAAALRTQAASSINQTVTNVNADAQKPGGAERVLKSISASTHLPSATLEKEKAKTGLSYGDLYIAHAIASAAGKKFDQIVALKTKGQTWDQIADANNVSFGGRTAKKEDTKKSLPPPASLSIQPKTSNNPRDISNMTNGTRP
ncbi:MAG: hypothetical protein QOE34_1251 [Verrucomicrobiota bacterium]|jgi:hypothetical protein